MGSVLYDYLHDRLLFDVSLIRDRFASVSDDALWEELHAYREFCLNHVDDLRAETQTGEGKLQQFGGHAFRNEHRLRQAALYVDTMVLPDPLFELSRQRSDQARTLDRFLNMRQREDFDRAALTKAAAFMVRAAPLVAADYIKFFPTSYYFEPPVQLPVRGPEATFRQSLPEEVRRVYEDSAVIRSMERTESGWRVGDTLERGRGISIAFDREGHLYGYHLFVQVVTEVDEAAREFQFRLTLADTPPDEQQFRVWVEQSIDRAVEQDLRALTTELAIAAACDSMYVTDSAFSGSVLGARFGPVRDVISDTATQVLNLELPILEGVGIDDIMRIRIDDGEAFASFRREMERQFSALRLERDPDQLRTRLQNVVHEITVGQVEQARQKVAGLQKQFFIHGAVGVAGLAGTVVTSGLSLAATVLALANGAKDFADYQAKKHENPGYFLWRVMGEKRKR